jgi:hypothetical protein
MAAVRPAQVSLPATASLSACLKWTVQLPTTRGDTPLPVNHRLVGTASEHSEGQLNLAVSVQEGGYVIPNLSAKDRAVPA